MTNEDTPQLGGIESAPIDELTNELRLDEVVAPLAAPGPNAGLLQ